LSGEKTSNNIVFCDLGGRRLLVPSRFDAPSDRGLYCYGNLLAEIDMVVHTED